MSPLCFDLGMTDLSGRRKSRVRAHTWCHPANWAAFHWAPAVIALGYRCREFTAGKSLTGVATGINACIWTSEMKELLIKNGLNSLTKFCLGLDRMLVCICCLRLISLFDLLLFIVSFRDPKCYLPLTKAAATCVLMLEFLFFSCSRYFIHIYKPLVFFRPFTLVCFPFSICSYIDQCRKIILRQLCHFLSKHLQENSVKK